MGYMDEKVPEMSCCDICMGHIDKKIIKNVIQHGIILFVVAIQKNIKQNIALMKNVVYAKNGIIIKILLNGFAKIIMKLLKKEWK